MPAIDWDQAVSTSFEIKNLLLSHWISVTFALIALYFLNNKYGNGLNGIPGPFLAGTNAPIPSLNQRFHGILQVVSSRGIAHKFCANEIERRMGPNVNCAPQKIWYKSYLTCS